MAKLTDITPKITRKLQLDINELEYKTLVALTRFYIAQTDRPEQTQATGNNRERAQALLEILITGLN